MNSLLRITLVAIVVVSTNFNYATAFAPPSKSIRSCDIHGGTFSKSIRPIDSVKVNFFGAPKDDGSPGDYICKDCGYVFTKGPAAWAKLPGSYGCPPCGSGKNRFTKQAKAGKAAKRGKAAAAAAPAKKKGWF
mmetsp:Transcript_18494/g.21289  ORF Transcript_18494/g.21289 Transcript_18494/m.21289 type:complete len:133 (-) Transcript_18494:114-512(-)